MLILLQRHAVPKETIMQVGKPTLLFWVRSRLSDVRDVRRGIEHRVRQTGDVLPWSPFR